VLAALILGACAAAPPRESPLAISYRWDPAPPVRLSYGEQPPAEISIRWAPGSLSPSAVDQLALAQCLGWNREPAPIETQGDSLRFRCKKPAAPGTAP
jgi:hypothetical protein